MNTILKVVLTTTLAVSAFAADKTLNFQTDFPFTVGKQVMPAGTYAISGTNDVAPGISVRSVDGKRKVFLTLPGRADANRSEAASVDFRCVEGQCVIASIANLRSGQRFSSWAPKANGPKATIISVNLTPAKNNAE